MDHDLIQVPSAGYLRYGNPVKDISRFPLAVLAFVDPVFAGSDPRLPPSRQMKATQAVDFARLPFTGEIDTIAQILPPSRIRVLRGFDANRDALLALSAGQPGILHLSTHAVIQDQTPELSEIVLSGFAAQGQIVNGEVLPHDVASLRLEGSIVVVSACRTALGKEVFGEGLMGFATSFFSTGAAQLILTLADVDAQASSVFMSHTYRHYFARGGTGMERAMTLARRSLLSSRQWSDPFYWASFTVIGTPSPQTLRERL
jgi:CHAT domain-containing protein